MSKRLKHEWQPTLKEAFNTPASEKGELAERMYLAWIQKNYDGYKYNIFERNKQNEGVDFEITHAGESFTVDVKGNYRGGEFFIDNWNSGWLRTKKADRIVHIDVETGDVLEYERKLMLERMDKPHKYMRQLLKFKHDDEDIKDLIKYYKVELL